MISKISEFLKSIGPGFIIAAVVLGPGSITVASKIGSTEGYSFLWVVAIGAISMSVYMNMSTRYGVTHTQSILYTISNEYGKWLALVIGICTFIASLSFQFGNNLGIGIGMKALTGIQEFIWPLIFTPLAIFLIFLTGNLYKTLEKLMMIIVSIMIFAFIFNLLFIKPDLIASAKGLLPSSINMSSFNNIAALVGTTFVLQGALFQSYLVQNKGWGLDDKAKSIRDSNLGVFMLALLSSLIIITASATLKPRGIEVNSAADMAIQLEKLLGNFAKYIFSFGFIAAAFSSLLVNAVTGGCLLADSLKMGRNLDSKMAKVFTTVILLIGMFIAVFFKGNIIYALIMAQASSMLGVPMIAVGMFLVANNKKIMKGHTNSGFQNILAVAGFILISVLVYFMYGKLIGYIQTL
jgi:NRAMP (natural resistance-associated macrophage protein)-like metal ion transporter